MIDLRRFDRDCLAFCDAAGIPLYPWQRREIEALTAFRPDGRPLYQVAAVSVPRSNGKTWIAAVIGLWRFSVAAPGDTLAASLSKDQASKLLRYAKRFVSGSRDLQRLVKVQRDHLVLRGTDHRFEIVSRDALMSRGGHYRTILFDEVGWVADSEQFETLLAGQGSERDPLMLLTSTVGRRRGPLQTVEQLYKARASGLYYSHSTDNRSPDVTAEYLDRQRKLLPPIIYSREHENTLRDGEDAFATDAEIKSAFAGHGHADPDALRYAFVDLATSGVASAAVASKRGDGTVIVEEVQVWRGSRKKPVQLSAVDAWIEGACKRYPNMELVQVESWQGVATVQTLEQRGYPVKALHQSAATKSAMMGNLQRLMIDGLISLPRNRQLQDELEGAVCEATASGMRVDGSPHPDVMVSVAGAALLAVEQREGPAGAGSFGFPGMLSGQYGPPPEQSYSKPTFSMPGGDFYERAAQVERETSRDWRVEQWENPNRFRERMNPPTPAELQEREEAERQQAQQEREYVSDCLKDWPANKPYALTIMNGVRLLHHRNCPNIAGILVAYGKGQVEDLIPLPPIHADAVRERHDCCQKVEAMP